MSDRVRGVILREGQDISALCNEVADRYAFPPRVLVATGIAESALSAQSERRGTWPDISAGPWHQAVAWAAGYGLGNGSNTPENIAAVFAVLKTDLARAADIAGQQLGRWWTQEQDGPRTLGRYNWPAHGLIGNPNRPNIERAWAASAAYVGGTEAPMPDRWAPLDVRDQFPEVGGAWPRRPLAAVSAVIYHHGASRTPQPTTEAELALLQEYAALHQRPGILAPEGAPTIAYHLAVGPSGTVYWCNGLTLETWHARAANPYSVGIVFLGNFGAEPPSAGMMDAARRARGWVAAQRGMLDLPFYGHRDYVATSCPGGWWETHSDWLAGLPEDAEPAPEPPAEEGEDPVVIEDLRAQLAERDTILGVLSVDVAAALQSALDSARTNDPGPSLSRKRYERRREAYAALQSAIATLQRRGGAVEE